MAGGGRRRRLHEAAIADLAAGGGWRPPSKPEEFFRGEVSTAATVETHQALGTLQFELVDVENSFSRSIRLDLTADMTGTLAVLKDLDLLPGSWPLPANESARRQIFLLPVRPVYGMMPIEVCRLPGGKFPAEQSG